MQVVDGDTFVMSHLGTLYMNNQQEANGQSVGSLA